MFVENYRIVFFTCFLVSVQLLQLLAEPIKVHRTWKFLVELSLWNLATMRTSVCSVLLTWLKDVAVYWRTLVILTAPLVFLPLIIYFPNSSVSESSEISSYLVESRLCKKEWKSKISMLRTCFIAGVFTIAELLKKQHGSQCSLFKTSCLFSTQSILSTYSLIYYQVTSACMLPRQLHSSGHHSSLAVNKSWSRHRIIILT